MHKSKNRYFYHIFVSPRDAPGEITLNVVWMEREFDAYKLSRSMYSSIFNSFPVIRTTSAKTRRFHVPQTTFLFPLETPLRLWRKMLLKSKNRHFTTLTVALIEREFDAYKLSRCMSPSNYNRFWDKARYWWKNRHFIIPPCIRRPR